MKKNIKPIQGQQLVPNPIGPECIDVTKVYDWVILTNRDRNKVPIPAACFAEIEACRAGGGIVTSSCSVIDTDFSISPERRPAPGVPGGVIVTVAFFATVRVEFTCTPAGTLLCGFDIPVSFLDEVILCAPEGTTINPIINQVNCDVLDAQMLGNMLLLEVVMCKEIRVTAPVILEVQAKFCGPRQPIPIEQPPFECPFPTFPPQCPTFFPPLNCECQGAADFSGEATIVVGGLPTAGQLDLLAFICDSCNPENSRLEVDYDDTAATPIPTPTPDAPGDQSFTFTATEIAQPDCTIVTVGGVDLVTGLSTSGTGVYTPAGGVPENATFTLILVDGDVVGGGPDLVTLVITTLSDGLVTIPLTSLTNLGLEVEAGDCDRFPDIPTTPAP